MTETTMDKARRIAREEPQHLDQALAMARASAVDDFRKIQVAERRATVNRLRKALHLDDWDPEVSAEERIYAVVVKRALDREAER